MPRLTCELCGDEIRPHGHYIVRIDVFADPSLPAMDSQELQKHDYEKTMQDLLEEMKHLSADDLQDQVHRRFEYRICRGCQARFLANPLGLPRERKERRN
jgi:hypothetical protein